MEMLKSVEAIAREAGAAILEVYERDFLVIEKEDKSPLTEADAAAQQIIMEGLSRFSLQLPVLSEEAVEDFTGPDLEGRYWLVDPLDGTKEFVKRNGEFTVNIALIQEGRPVLGVVYSPVLDVMYSAANGLGAFKTTSHGEREQIKVADHVDGEEWRIVGSRSHAGDSLQPFLEKLGHHRLLSVGSSLKFCLVAEGKADIYVRLGPTCLWDTAAGQCIVEQAGGEVIQLTGDPLSYLDTGNKLNPYFLVHGRDLLDWRATLLALQDNVV